jgi:hypothetical protein
MLMIAQTIARSAKNCQWIRCRVVAKSAESGGPVFTYMDGLLYRPLLGDGQYLYVCIFIMPVGLQGEKGNI